MPAKGGSVVSTAEQHPPDLVVVGGGAIGLAVAWRAVATGMGVMVLERGELGREASHVAAGMLAPVAEASFAERELLALGLESAARWPAFARGLLDSGGVDPGLHACGTLLVAPDRDQAAALDRELRFRESLGLPVRRLRPSEARRMEPGLAPAISAALDVPGDHAVDSRALTAALAAAAAAAGVTLRPRTPVAGLLVEDGAAAGVVLAGGERVAAGAVVIAAGCWSAGLEGIPREARVPVRPVKGQILRLRDPSGPGLLTRVLRTEEAYLVPRGDGRYVLGATMEERGFDTTVTAGAVHELLRAAAGVLPGILELELEEAAAGLRPGTPDNAPVLGPSVLPGLHWATGHHRNGILLTPVTADLVVAGVLDGRLPEMAAPFAAERFTAGVTA
jgi:glycine oxidase